MRAKRASAPGSQRGFEATDVIESKNQIPADDRIAWLCSSTQGYASTP